jgi:hypothetical protein
VACGINIFDVHGASSQDLFGTDQVLCVPMPSRSRRRPQSSATSQPPRAASSSRKPATPVESVIAYRKRLIRDHEERTGEEIAWAAYCKRYDVPPLSRSKSGRSLREPVCNASAQNQTSVQSLRDRFAALRARGSASRSSSTQSSSSQSSSSSCSPPPGCWVTNVAPVIESVPTCSPPPVCWVTNVAPMIESVPDGTEWHSTSRRRSAGWYPVAGSTAKTRGNAPGKGKTAYNAKRAAKRARAKARANGH